MARPEIYRATTTKLLIMLETAYDRDDGDIAEEIEDELAKREEEGIPPDSPSLQDIYPEMPSYGN